VKNFIGRLNGNKIVDEIIIFFVFFNANKIANKKKTSTRYFPMIFREQFHKHCKMLWNFA